jgi:hypothetical protein
LRQLKDVWLQEQLLKATAFDKKEQQGQEGQPAGAAPSMVDLDYGGQRLTMLSAGDEAEANQVAARLAAEVGFEPIELGPLRCSRLLEPLAMTWIVLARRRGLGRDFALDVVRRPPKQGPADTGRDNSRPAPMPGW